MENKINFFFFFNEDYFTHKKIINQKMLTSVNKIFSKTSV